MHKGGSGLGLQACGARRRGDGGLQCGEATAGFAKAERKFMATDARSGGRRLTGPDSRERELGQGRVGCSKCSAGIEVSGSRCQVRKLG